MFILSNCKIGVENTEVIPVEKAVRIEAASAVDNLIVVYNSSEKTADTDVFVLYNTLNKVISKADHVALIVTDVYDRNTKILGLLLAKYRVFNLFVMEELVDIDDEYIEAISESTVSQEELAQFVGRDIAAYAVTRDVTRELSNSISKSDSTIADLVRGNKDNIHGISTIFELIQQFSESACEQATKGGGSTATDAGIIQRNSKEIQRLTALVEELNRSKTQVDIKLEKAEKKIEELEDYKEGVETSLASNPLSDNYVTLDVNKFVNVIANGRRRPIIKDIIYFKEISPCRYINSFVVKFNKYMITQLGVKCKLVIFDRESFFNFRYGALKVVNGGSYAKLKRANELGDVFVATKADRSIIEDLITENEILIFYDRMGAENNIVSGRAVHEYYVLNSLKEYNELNKHRHVDMNWIVTNFGVDKHMLSIPDIMEYKMMSEGGKLSAYVNMPSTIDVTKSIFEIVFNDCGMLKWAQSKRY